MTVTLSIQIVSPLTPDDHDLLAGLAVMTLAIANREFNQSNITVEQTEEEPQPEPEEQKTCGQLEYVPYDESGPTATGKVCVREPHATGRHKFRDPRVAPILVN